MKLQIKRMAALLLCTLLLLAVLPAQVFAADRTDFNAILEAGQTGKNAIYVVTEPVFYTSEVQSFSGDYAIYLDAATGVWGITDYRGNVVYYPGEDDPIPVIPVCDNVFLGGSYSDQTYGSGWLYDFQGNLLYSERLGKRNCGGLTDSKTGKCNLYWALDRSMSFSSGGGGGYEAWFCGRIGSSDGKVKEADRISPPVNGMVTYQQNGKWGLRVLFGEELLPLEYDLLMFVSSDVLLFRQNGKNGLMGTDGSVQTEAIYDSAIPCPYEDGSLIQVGQNGKFGIMTADGSFPVPLCFDEIVYCGAYSDHYEFYGTVDGAGTYYCGNAESYWLMDDPSNNRIPLAWPGMYFLSADNESQIVDEQNQPLIEEYLSASYYQTDEILVVYLPQENLTRFYDRNLTLLTELPGYPMRTELGFAFVQHDENWRPTTVFYDEGGQLVNTLPEVEILFLTDGCPILRREDRRYALADGLGNLRTDFEFAAMLEISSGWDELRYPFFAAIRPEEFTGTNYDLYEIIDSHSLQNVLGDGCKINSDTLVLPEGSYFPFFKDGKTGFARLTARGESPFRDVGENSWYSKPVKFCYSAGLMSGTGNAQFSPKGQTTRAALVQMLYKISGEETASYGFTDVPEGKWYTRAVNWAAANGIVSGKTPTRFAPNDPVTREQLVTILYKYAASFTPQSTDHSVLEPYADKGSISAYALNGMAWAVQNGILSGKTADTVVPKGKASRAEIATIMMRFVQYMAACQAGA